MDEEQQEALRECIIEEYKDLMFTPPNEETIAVAFLKLNKIATEVEILGEEFLACKYDVIEMLLRLDVVLGAVAEIRKDIKAAL